MEYTAHHHVGTLTVVVNVGVDHVAIHIDFREDLFIGLVNAETANLFSKTAQSTKTTKGGHKYGSIEF